MSEKGDFDYTAPHQKECFGKVGFNISDLGGA